MGKDGEKPLDELKQRFREFAEARDWDQFHNAKDLSMALSIEAGELMEHFRWKSPKEVEDLFKDESKKHEVGEEMADILTFLLRMSQLYDIDLSDAFEKKLEKTGSKYPIDKFKGSNKKYDERL